MPLDDHAGPLGSAVVLTALALPVLVLLGLVLGAFARRSARRSSLSFDHRPADHRSGRPSGRAARRSVRRAARRAARRGGRVGIAAEREDFGLLRVAALADDREGAQVVCGLLARAGIRATIGPEAGGAVRVLVFVDDLDRARTVVSGPPV